MLTVLGDYWIEQVGQLPSTALVRVMADFGITEGNARAALSRLARRGLLKSFRQGRRTSYALTSEAHTILREGTQRIFSFGSASDAWDGTWTLVSFSIPEHDRSLRGSLRQALRWLGFAVLNDALWIAPGDRRLPAASALRDLGVSAATIVTGEAFAPDHAYPIVDWGLDQLQRDYRVFVDCYAPVLTRLRRTPISGAEALTLRTSLIDTWRTFPGSDSEIPRVLLPPDWPGAEAHRVFVEVYNGLGQAAASRFAELIAIDDPQAASHVRFHTAPTDPKNSR